MFIHYFTFIYFLTQNQFILCYIGMQLYCFALGPNTNSLTTVRHSYEVASWSVMISPIRNHLRWNSCCVIVTLRQKTEKIILSRGQKHIYAICMPTRRLLMIHFHHGGEVKQVTALCEAWLMTLLLCWICIASDLTVSVFLGFQSDHWSDCVIIVPRNATCVVQALLQSATVTCNKVVLYGMNDDFVFISSYLTSAVTVICYGIKLNTYIIHSISYKVFVVTCWSVLTYFLHAVSHHLHIFIISYCIWTE